VKRVVASVAALLFLAACSSSGGGGTKSGSSSPPADAGPHSLTVFAASSLTEAFTTIKAQFEKAHPGTSVTFSFGASSDLSAQIAQGAPADVFASASPKNMNSVVSAGDASNPANFVSNTLEIAVPPSNPAKITSVKDLAKPSVKVAICNPAVPCGAVAAQVFTKAKIKVKPKASLADVKSTLAAVESGEVDAGCVYVTDVRSAGSKVKGIKIPANINASTEYPIVALKHAKNPSLAKAFVSYVQSAAGRKVLTADGFQST
jgi:molybdate transport system substrate-binding protein